MTTEQMKTIIRRYYEELWNEWNLSIADEILGECFTFRGSLGITVWGIEAFKRYMKTVQCAFPDFHNNVEELIGEGDTVVARLTYSGTHEGELFGVPPTHKQIIYSGIAIFHFAGTKIANGWVIADLLALFEQLGVERRSSGTEK